MGCDGGSIPLRIELVKTKARAIKLDPKFLAYANWYFCALSKLPLQQPIVADNLGRMYNKEAMLSYLLDKNAYGDGDLICSHISKPRDLINLKLTPNPAYSESSGSFLSQSQASVNPDDNLVAKFICPISQKEMNGKHRFNIITTCGCVVSEQAFKEIPSTSCLICTKPFTPLDVIPINPSDEELPALKTRLEKIKASFLLLDADKKSKKKDGESKKRKKEAGEKVQGIKKQMVEQTANVNLSLPKLDSVINLKASEAIKSLYVKPTQGRETFLTKGTFNRYSAY
ncbi:hypothetical protein HK098_000287 [Nowakowskiella sp. JEL0407]|nr:hypothetical protein HK098_000287 [Nowakowskiella sp. JEL0407]